MQSFRKLQVWEKSLIVAQEIYASTAAFPDRERFGLTGQLRRAVVSIGANIAEGTGRRSSADFARFLFMAMGSANEVESCLELAARLGFLSQAAHDRISIRIIEIKKMIVSQIRRLQTANS